MGGNGAYSPRPVRAPAGVRVGGEGEQWLLEGGEAETPTPLGHGRRGAPDPTVFVCTRPGRHGELSGGRGAERGGPTFPAALG